MEQRNNIISVFEYDELSEMHKSYNENSVEELDAEYDALVDELETFELKFTKKQATPLVALLESETLFELPFTLSRGILELHESLKKGEVVNIGQYRIFQKIYTSTKFKTLGEAKILLDALELTRTFNISIAKIEEKLKIVSQYRTRKEQEVETGLEFKEGDAETRLEVE